MAIRKLKQSSSNERVLELYYTEVDRYLRHLPPSENLDQLPLVLQDLLHARNDIRKGKPDKAIVTLSRHSDPNPLITAEISFVMGNAFYDLPDFLKASLAYEKAMGLYQSLPGQYWKALRARFNLAQCLDELGKRDQGCSLRAELLRLAEESGFENLRGLCLRALADDALRKNDIESAHRFFRSARSSFMLTQNESDADYAALLALCCEFALKMPLDMPVAMSAKALNRRSDRLRAFIQLLLADSDVEQKIQALKDCDPETQDMLRLMGISPQSRSLGMKRKMSSAADQLLDFLRQNGPSTKEEVIEKLWGTQGIYSSLEQRLWTLVSRINQRRKLIYRDAKGRYGLI